jgi:hypothetical protein
MTDVDKALITNYLLGGAALGAGAAGVTALLNNIREVHREATGANPLQKDTLKLTLKRPKGTQMKMAREGNGEQSSSFLRGPFAITGGLVTALGSYAAGRALHQYFKRKALAKELEQAQSSYLTTLDPNQPETEQKKLASGEGKGMGWDEALTSIPLTGALLTALAAAAVSNAALRKTFPDVKPGTRLGPKRVVLDYEDDDQPPMTIPLEKAATAFLLDTVADAGIADSPTRDLIAAVAKGRLEELRKVASEQGIEMVMDVVHGASRTPASILRTKLASRLLADDGLVGPMALFLAAAELTDAAPMHTKLAAFMEPELEQAMVKHAAYCQHAYYSETLLPLLETCGPSEETKATFPKSAAMRTLDLLPMSLIPGLN